MGMYFWTLIIIIGGFPLSMLRWLLAELLIGNKLDIKFILKKATIEWVVATIFIIVLMLGMYTIPNLVR